MHTHTHTEQNNVSAAISTNTLPWIGQEKKLLQILSIKSIYL